MKVVTEYCVLDSLTDTNLLNDTGSKELFGKLLINSSVITISSDFTWLFISNSEVSPCFIVTEIFAASTLVPLILVFMQNVKISTSSIWKANKQII